MADADSSPPPADCGIYAIRSPSGKQYIGQAALIARRWYTHKCELRAGRHHCKPLQHAWNKYGEERMEFIRLKLVERSELNAVEQAFLTTIGRAGLYNTALFVVGPLRGHTFSAEHRAALSAAGRGRKMSDRTKAALLAANLGAKRSDEYRVKLSGRRGPLSANFGRVVPEEQRRKMSDARRGRFVGVNSPLYGVPKSEQHRARLSEALRGKLVGALNPVAKPIACLDNGMEFATTQEAVNWLRATGKPKADLSTLRKVVAGKLRSAYGYRWGPIGK
jgi:group I intron endonuclease